MEKVDQNCESCQRLLLAMRLLAQVLVAVHKLNGKQSETADEFVRMALSDADAVDE